MRCKTEKNSKKTSEIEIMGNTIDRIEQLRTFEPFDKPIVGCRFYRFRNRGESIEGMLGFPIVNYRQGTSYPLQLDNGEIVEIVANKLLHKQINKGELCGKRVKIIYIGRDYTYAGRCRKVYRVFKIDYPKIFSRKQWLKIIDESKKGAKKNGKTDNMQKLSSPLHS
jgi:hypothetical protein